MHVQKKYVLHTLLRSKVSHECEQMMNELRHLKKSTVNEVLNKLIFRKFTLNKQWMEKSNSVYLVRSLVFVMADFVPSIINPILNPIYVFALFILIFQSHQRTYSTHMKA